MTRTATYTGATSRRPASSNRVRKRADNQSSIMPQASRTSAPVERQRTVVPIRIGRSTEPKGICPILLIAPQRHSHQPASDAAVIHIPHSSPV